MKLLTAREGWVLAGQRLLWTNTGGTTWIDITPSVKTTTRIEAVFFLDTSSGWVLLSQGPGAGAQFQMTIASTRDGGMTWSRKPFVEPEKYGDNLYFGEALDFADVLHGWVMLRAVSSSNFDFGALFTTTDGGDTWTRLPDPPAGDPVRFVTANDGWMAGGPIGDKLYATPNGGISWNPIAVVPPSAQYAAFRAHYELPTFKNLQDGILPVTYAVPGTSVLAVYRSHDAGQTWEFQEVYFDGGGNGNHVATSVVNSTIVRVNLSSGRISTASGRQRALLAIRPPRLTAGAAVLQLEFASEMDGWLLTADGSCSELKTNCSQKTFLLKTSDGGRTFNDITPQLESPATLNSPPSWGESPSSRNDQEPSEIPSTLSAPSPLSSGTEIGRGEGFDKACVEITGNMQTWWNNSPFRFASAYIGGDNVSCKIQPALNASWVSQVRTMGWGIMPLWVGPQAPCNDPSKFVLMSDDPSQGASEADSASSAASSLGIGGTIIYYDLEHYNATSSCSATVSGFISSWVAELHAMGYQAGVYGSPLNAKVDWVSIANVPDAAWIAEWDGVDSVIGLADISDSLWTTDQRIHQYIGDNTVSYGGLTLNIDNDVLDGPIVPSDGSPPLLDDYPYKAAPICTTTSCPSDTQDPYGFFYRECTSFVAWRMNRDAGSVDPAHPSFTNTMNGGRWGNAANWNNNATMLGYTVDGTPTVGSVAQWSAGECGGCTLGHLAYVESINGDGSVNVSEYNFEVDHAYDFRSNVRPPRFIHINGSSSPPATGTIIVNATVNGSPWPASATGVLAYNLNGPSAVSGAGVPQTFTSITTGTYSLTYVSGGPTGSAPDTITPASALLTAGGSLTFTLNFSNACVAASTSTLLSLKSPSSSCSSPPTTTTTAATSISTTTVSLNGSVNPNGLTTNGWFEWGTDSTFSSYSSTTAQSLGFGTTGLALSASLTGLTPGVTYFFRAAASNSAGTSRGVSTSFTTLSAVAPAVSTSPASSITSSGATLNGQVNPNGSATTAWFEYGTDSSLTTHSSTSSQSVGSDSLSHSISASLSGLSTNMTYYYRVAATNAGGTNRSSAANFTTMAATSAPTVTTAAASSVGTTTVALNGSVNPNGLTTNGWFEWGTDSTFTTYSSTPSQSLGSGTTSQTLSASLTGLTPGTTYYFRAAASNSAGTNRGSGLNFATLAAVAPAVSTSPASSITSSGATLNGQVNPNGSATTAWFEYGINSALATYTSTSPQSVGSDSLSHSISASLSGLSASTTYYFRVAANNAGGTNRSSIANFTTTNSGSAPAVTTAAASSVGTTTVALNGSVNPNGLTTNGWFEWGTDSTFTTYSSTPSQSLGSGTTSQTLSASLTGLTPGTTYYFRAAASNSAGTNRGSSASFTALSGAAPVATLSATSLNFGNQLVGTASAVQTVTLTNSSAGTLTITSIVASGDFAQTNTCGTSVAVGANCTVSVTFTPTVAGPRAGTLTFTDNASNSPQSVALSGTGIALAPIASVSVPSLPFGSEVVGTPSAAQTVTVTNTGTAPLNFSSLAASGDFSVDASGTTCSSASPLAVSASCAIAVTFTPSATGTRTGSLTLTDDAGTQTVALSGTGTTPGASLSPSSLTFGSQVVGAVGSVQTVTLTNTGTSGLNMTGITSSGDFAQTNTCGTLPAVIAPSASCAISVTFTPTATGARTGSFTVTDDASGGTQTVALSGTGTTPDVTLTPSTVTFSTQPVGSPGASQSVVLANTGTSNLHVTAISISGDFSQANSCGTLPAVVAPGGTCTFNVQFTPTAVGARTGTITITGDAGSSPQTVSLSGIGVVPTPGVAPTSLSFAAQGLDSTSSSQTVTVTNSSTVPLTLTSATISGANAADFATSADTCTGATVAAGDHCSLNVAFTPSAIGARSATLSFADNAFGSPQTVALAGTGAPATLTITANNASRVYGAANPTFTATYSGFVHGDTSSSLSGTLSCTTTATTSSAAGTYPITCSGQSSANYTITYVAGTLTVTTTALTITANNATRTYGAANPAFTADYSGFVNGDTASSLGGTLSCTTTATTSSASGTYPITCAGQSSTNYSITYSAGTLTVTTAALTITANNATRTYGAVSPTFAAAYSGFVGGDTSSSLSGTLSCTTTATTSSASGTYPITCSGQSSANYSITFVAGVLTVSKATPAFSGITGSQTISYGTATVTMGGKIAAGAAIPVGENARVTLNGVSQSAAIAGDGSFSAVFNTSTLAASSATYLITYNYAGDANFGSTSDTSTSLTVTPGFSVGPTSGSSTSQSVAAGQPANFSLSFTASGTTGTLATSCSGAPVGAACVVSPPTQVLTGGSSATATVTVTTTAHVESPPAARERRWFGGWPGEISRHLAHLRLRPPVGVLWMVTLASLLALTGAGFVKLRRRRVLALLGATIILASAWVACGGGGGNGGGGNTAPPPTPNASLSPSALTFSSQNQGTTSAAQTVMLTNNGNATLIISGVNVGGTNPSDFALASTGTTCSASAPVPANTSCTMNVTFSPTATGTRAGAVTISDNASPSPQTVALTGTGVPPVTPPGTYALTVTAELTTSTGTVTHTLPLTLIVN